MALPADDAALNDFYAQIKSLSRPVEVRRVDMMTDGGTISVALAGREGKDLDLCLNDYLGSGDRGSLFVNAGHATSPGAVKVLPGSDLETLIVDVLQEWLLAPGEVSPAYRQLIGGLLQRVNAHRVKAKDVARQGGMTREKAVDIASKSIKPILSRGYKNVIVTEEPGKYVVTFEAIPFVDAKGVSKESDMSVGVSRDTGEVLYGGASAVRERK